MLPETTMHKDLIVSCFFSVEKVGNSAKIKPVSYSCMEKLSFWFQVLSDGAYGCQFMPGDSDGARPWENVLPALPDAMWNQASALSGHHSQGRKAGHFSWPALQFAFTFMKTKRFHPSMMHK